MANTAELQASVAAEVARRLRALGHSDFTMSTMDDQQPGKIGIGIEFTLNGEVRRRAYLIPIGSDIAASLTSRFAEWLAGKRAMHGQPGDHVDHGRNAEGVEAHGA